MTSVPLGSRGMKRRTPMLGTALVTVTLRVLPDAVDRGRPCFGPARSRKAADVLGWIWELAPTALAFLVVWGLIALAVLAGLRLRGSVQRPARRRRVSAS